MDVEQVKACYTSEEGYQMMLKAEVETKNMTPGPLFVPTIVFDDVRYNFIIFRVYVFGNNIYVYNVFIYLQQKILHTFITFSSRNTTSAIKTTRSQTSNLPSARN